MKTSGLSAINRLLCLVVIASLPMVFGFKGCSGSGSASESGGGGAAGLLTCPPIPTTKSGPSPAGGFCTAAEDINMNGITVPHLQATITGNWVEDLVSPAPVGTTESFTFSNPAGWPQYVSGGRLNAVWDGTEIWANEPWCPGDESVQQWSGTGANGSITAQNLTWPIFTCLAYNTSDLFYTFGATPTTITLPASGLTTANGMPHLVVYNTNIGTVSTLSATAVAANGSSATFAFPTHNGAALPAGDYAFAVDNQSTSGVFIINAVGSVSIGTPITTYTTPFGIDVGDYSSTSTVCISGPLIAENGGTAAPDTGGETCTTITVPVTPSPAVTSFSNGTMSYRSINATVGSQPTSVKLFDIESVYSVQTSGSVHTTTTTDGPLYAMTTNFGSNTVSFVTPGQRHR
jgi:hypothetical protein